MDPAIPNHPAEDPGACRKPGRPRCDETSRAILRAAFEIMQRGGYGALTIEGVAEQAGVGKTTGDRWWQDRAALAVHAFFATVSPRIPVPDTGSVRGDFEGQLRLVIEQMGGPNGGVLRSIIGAAQMDERVAQAFRERWLAPRRAEGRAALERAQARGELPADLDQDFFFDVLYGPLYLRLMIGHQPLTEEFLQRLLRGVFDVAMARDPGRGAVEPRG